MKRAWAALVVSICATLFVVITGCDEVLPPRDDPQDILSADYFVIEGTVVVRDSQVVSSEGTFITRFVNKHSEVLQAEEGVAIDIEVWMKDQPANIAHVHGDKMSLTKAVVSGGLLTLRPRDTVSSALRWSHRTDSNRPFWNFVNLHPRVTQRGELYQASDPIRFVAQGTLRTFKARAALKLPEMEFTLVYNIF
jgi:hypothetical protein